MSEEEVERFEITDYDLENEFNINRRGRRLSKNKQIYGIWAEDSEEEELPRTSFKGSGSRDYSAPVSFISAGIQNQKKDEKKERDDEDSKNDPPPYNSSDSEEETPRAGFGRRKEVKSNPTGGVGVWERHTKGIGAKLLLQMGYQPGKGLGKNLQGISSPVEAKLRRGRGAIGAYGPEQAQRATYSEVKQLEEKKSKISAISGSQQWRKSKNSGKPRYFYKTIDEVIEDGHMGRSVQRDEPVTNTSHLSKVKVIDMTGPEQRVLSGYHAIAGQKRPTDQIQQHKNERSTQHFSLPELQHNLRLLLDLCEQEIIENDRERRHLADRSVALERDERELTETAIHSEEQANSLESLLEQIEHLEPSAKAFKELQEEYPNEWRLHGLDDLAIAVATTVIQSRLRNWRPLLEPNEPLVDVTSWHEVLDISSESYGKVLWHAWLPTITNSIINDWKARDDPEAMVKLIEYWSPPLIPLWIHQHILEQLVLPKIQNQVNEWDPLTDTVPVHAWILPWLPWLSSRFETTVFSSIRSKFGSALQAWHANDASAKRMLEPWRKVFSQGDMDAFLTRHIVPKLAEALNKLDICPSQQHLEYWHWAMNWEDMLPPYIMAGLLEEYFFPKWLEILRYCLKHNSNLDEIFIWFKGWQKLFSENLQAQPSVKENFRYAMELLNREMSINANSTNTLPGLGRPPPPPPPPPIPQSISSEIMQPLINPLQTSAKEFIEMRCRERGILFVPIPNRYRESKQIYRCGKLLLNFSKDHIYIQDATGQWLPSDLSNILSMAE